MGMVSLHSGSITREDSEKVLEHIRGTFMKAGYGDGAWKEFVRDHVVVTDKTLHVGVSEDKGFEDALDDAANSLSGFLSDNRMNCAVAYLSSYDDEPAAGICTRDGNVEFGIEDALEKARAAAQAEIKARPAIRPTA